jgi:hypothetical protein
VSADELPGCVDLGLADIYAVASQHGARPYIVACLFDGQWLCSCPAEHKTLRAGGKYCRPIREVIALRSAVPLPPVSERKRGS